MIFAQFRKDLQGYGQPYKKILFAAADDKDPLLDQTLVRLL